MARAEGNRNSAECWGAAVSVLRVVIACLLVLAAVNTAAAQAPARHALLIGNQAYTGEIGALTNPHNDVALLEATLKRLGFKVTVARDARLGATNVAINRYLRTLSGAGPGAIGFFYYSGHGAADGTTNYLIPVDATSTDTAELWDQSLRLGEITRRLKVEAGNATHFVVFDACRNTLKLREPGKRTIVQAKGFRAERQEAGMLISYATAEGELASDVGQGAGPYAKVLAEEIITPGVEAVTMFRNVQRRVRAAIRQEPYLGFNALGDVYFAGKAAVPAAAAPTAPAPASAAQASRAEVAAFCREIATNPSPAIVETLRDAYKGTPMAGCAQARLDELKRQLAATAQPPTTVVTPHSPASAAPPPAVHGVEKTKLYVVTFSPSGKLEGPPYTGGTIKSDFAGYAGTLVRDDRGTFEIKVTDVNLAGQGSLQHDCTGGVPLSRIRIGDIVRMKPSNCTMLTDYFVPGAAFARPAAAIAAPLCDGVEVALGSGKPACIKPGSGRSFRDCSSCPEMVVVSAGSFIMGSPAGEVGRHDNEDQVAVTIPTPIAVARFSVTFDQWDACIAVGGCGGHEPNDWGWGRGKRPVIDVNWHDAKAYADWVSRKTGKT